MPLVEYTPPPDREDVDLVSIFRSVDPGRIALAKSILHSAGVPFFMKNEAFLGAEGFGPFINPAGFNPALGSVEIMVSPSDAEDARLMVKDLEGLFTWGDAGEEEGEEQG